MTELSTEAKVMAFSFWGIISHSELSFARPHIITPQARKGLDDLVEAGLLTVERFNKYTDKLVWKPTDKMKTDKPKVSMAFAEKHSFRLTDENQANKRPLEKDSE